MKYLMKLRYLNCKVKLWNVRMYRNVGDPNFCVCELPVTPLRPPKAQRMVFSVRRVQQCIEVRSGTCGSSLLSAFLWTRHTSVWDLGFAEGWEWL